MERHTVLRRLSMKIINFGSLNIDYVYQVPHFVRPGETLSGLSFKSFPGGKGLNQSVALARAGAEVFHAGKIGTEGEFLKNILSENGADTSLLFYSNVPTGHAVIQVSPQGENSIILFGGANLDITLDDLEKVFNSGKSCGALLLQNEINLIPEIIRKGRTLGMKIFFNPAPFGPEVLEYPLELVDYLVVNEIEGRELSGRSSQDDIIKDILNKWPQCGICLTLGKNGALYADSEGFYRVPAYRVSAVDTTAAGDTFTGYFASGICMGLDIAPNLKRACAAAALCVTKPGAAVSIPLLKDVEEFMNLNPV